MAKPFEFNIKKLYADLRPSEQKVADYYLGYAGQLEELSLVPMAKAAGVSKPTVMRFVKALGFGGFREFKYAVLKAASGRGSTEADAKADSRVDGSGGAVPPPLVCGYGISEEDRPEEVPGQVITRTISYLDDALKHISPSEIIKAAGMICSAGQVAVYYVENSATVAHDLVTKLLYLGINCVTYNDVYLQQISAGNLGEQDVAIGISYSGTSKSTVDVMKLAKRKGASTIVLTNYDDVLIGKYADIMLCTGNRQQLYGNAIFSRTSQIAVVDMIYTGIILRDYPKYTKKLDESSRIVRNQTY